MKQIEVVAAIIQNGNKIFATQRASGQFANGWEFPGGKLEPGESKEAAVKREIREELAAEIHVKELFHTVEYDYPDFHLTMDCFLCEVADGTLTLLEHKAARWLGKEELDDVNWLPADCEIVEKLRLFL